MTIVMIIMLFYLEVYAIFLAVNTVVHWVKGKKFSYLILLVNILLITLFYMVRQKLFHHEWILFGNYNDADDWSGGLANVMVSMYNLVFLFVLFIITQVVFWILFLREKKKLNERTDYKNMLHNSFN